MQSKPPLSYHPLLLFTYYLFFFFENNKQETYISDLYLPLIAGIGFIVLLFGIFRLLLGSFSKAGMLTSFSIFLFFLYDDIIYKINKIPFGEKLLEIDKNFFATYSFIFLLVFIYIKCSKRSFLGTTRFLNLFSIILIIFPIASYTFHQIQILKLAPADNKISLPKHTQPKHKRDVYYIILDSYTNKDNLKRYFGFNNQRFITYLEEKGFFVANESRSNYQNTLLSMPSALNMDYHNIPQNIDDEDIIISLLKDKIDYSKVSSVFKQLGYKTISLARVNGTAKNYDERVGYNKLFSPFLFSLLDKSLIKKLNLDFLNSSLIHRSRTLYNFDLLKKVSKLSEPTFFYAHFMLPHPPWVFDRDGKIPGSKDTDKPTNPYLEQLMFANKKIKIFLDDLLLNSEVEPIIIIQGDHGYEPNRRFIPNEKKLRKIFGVLNAYYFPGLKDTGLYSNITPVNSFRLLFNKYFGMNFELLPDKSFWESTLSKSWRVFQLPPLPKSTEDPKSLETANDMWINYLEKTSQEDPENFEVHLLLGWNYFLTDQNEKAIKSIKESIRLNPKFPNAYSSLGRVYIKLKQYENGMKVLETALKLNPDDLETQLHIALYHLNKGNNQKVIDILNAPNKENSNYIETYILSGRAFYNLKRFQSAIKSYKKGLAINPWQHELHYLLGEVYDSLKLYPNAIESYKTSLSIKKWQAKTNLKLALSYEKNNDHQNAYKFALVSQALSKTTDKDLDLKIETNKLLKRLKKKAPEVDIKKSFKKIEMKKIENLIFGK